MEKQNTHPVQNKPTKRGFAAMDAEKQREISRKGGESVAPQDRSFSRNPQLAAEAGRKGGQASHANRKRQQQEQQEQPH